MLRMTAGHHAASTSPVNPENAVTSLLEPPFSAQFCRPAQGRSLIRLYSGVSAAALAAAARGAADAYGAKFGVLVGAADWPGEGRADLALASWRAFAGRWLAAARAAQRGDQAHVGGFVHGCMEAAAPGRLDARFV